MDDIAKKREEIRENAAKRKRLEIRERLLRGGAIKMIGNENKEEVPRAYICFDIDRGRHKTPYAFLKAANNFTNFINKNFVFENIYGERFPIESYMKSVYDLITHDQECLVLDSFHVEGPEVDGGRKIKILSPNKKEKSIILERYCHDKLYFDTIEASALKNRARGRFSENGCIQYLHFSEFAETFMHSFVLTSLSELYSIIREPKDYVGTGLITRYLYVNEQQLAGVLKKYRSDDDFIPSVDIDDERCIIEWIEYRPCNGITKCKYEVYKDVDNTESVSLIDKLNYKLISRESILELKEEKSAWPTIHD